MGLSRSTSILILLVIDTTFFFVELISGYAVGSLALVADSFHMLNDVLSLAVGYYAIHLTSKSAEDARLSYGYHRAEILAALVNGVFLLALCFSIIMEAIERFFSTPEISNPALIVAVGTMGLISNFVGLFLFHEHSHSHSHSHSAPATPKITERTPLLGVGEAYEDPEPTSPKLVSTARRARAGSSSSHFGHPIQTRAYVVRAAEDIGYRATSPLRQLRSPTSGNGFPRGELTEEENTGIPNVNGNGDLAIDIDEERISPPIAVPISSPVNGEAHSSHTPQPKESSPTPPSHNHSHDHGGHGHSHGSEGSMNMRALILHVMGDALGNVGVIATGLIIWLTDWPLKYYCDPIISLVITVIIFHSALPLVRSASFILLQGAPSTIPLQSLRQSIQDVPGVLAMHELHVWQLSESKIIASVHVWVDRSMDYMSVAANIREALHEAGVHSCTIQPEFHDHEGGDEHLKTTDDTQCLLPCPPGSCSAENACCPPGVATPTIVIPSSSRRVSPATSLHNHDHDHDHGHSHSHDA